MIVFDKRITMAAVGIFLDGAWGNSLAIRNIDTILLASNGFIRKVLTTSAKHIYHR